MIKIKIFLCLNLIIFSFFAQEKIHIYTFYSDSHIEYKDKWFLPSIKDNFDLHVIKVNQEGDGSFNDPGFNITVQKN